LSDPPAKIVKEPTSLDAAPMDVRTVLTGPFPRSEPLVAATRDLDRGRANPEAVEARFAEDERAVVALESRLGLDASTGGYLRWADLFRPFSEGWPGFTVGPVTRWFQTNTFFRQPILHAPPERTAGVVRAALPSANVVAPERANVILPGPFTFAGLLDNRSGETREALTHRFGRLLAEDVRELRAAGYRLFQFQEPLLVVAPPTGPLAEATIAAYRSLSEAAHGGTTVIWTYFGDAAPVQPLLHRLPVNVVGVDLAETEPEAIEPSPHHRGLGLGCLDPRTTLNEDAGEVARIATLVRDKGPLNELWLGPGGPLDLLPTEAAARKLDVLPATKKILDRPRGAS
jgi:5-methyltetrahydropteroyltriglutamate--homocysteine methyltransferase